MKSELRGPKSETQTRLRKPCVSDLGLRPSFGFRFVLPKSHAKWLQFTNRGLHGWRGFYPCNLRNPRFNTPPSLVLAIRYRISDFGFCPLATVRYFQTSNVI